MTRFRIPLHRARWLGLSLACVGLWACAGPGAGAGPGLERHGYEQAHMGTTFRIVLYAPDRATADAAAAAAFARVAALDAALSDYDPGSELSRLSRASDAGPTGPLAVSADLFEVLEAAQALSAASGGAFDVTVGPCVRLWRRAARQGRAPEPAALETARAAVGWRHLTLDREARTVALGAAGMRLDLGGIAKGHALDEALAALAARGVERALVDGGGDVAAGSPPPGRSAWVVAVAPGGELGPDAPRLALAHAAVATSGDRYRGFELEGVRYSHLVDPRCGRALESRRAASVVAPSGALADGLASALCVLDSAQGLRWVETMANVEALVLDTAEKGEGRGCQSSGWARMISRETASSPATPPGAPEGSR